MTKQKPINIVQEHDRLFRNFFDFTFLAKEVLVVAAEHDFAELIKRSEIRVCPDRLDSRDLTYRATDVLFDVMAEGQSICLNLMVEHQSTVARDMLPDLVEKTVLLWRKRMSERPERRAPVHVRTVVISNASEPWLAPTDTDDWLRGLQFLTGAAFDTRFRFVYDVLDLHGRSLDYFVGIDASASTRSFLFALNVVREPDFVTKIEEFSSVLSRVRMEPQGVEVLKLLITYWMVRRPDMTQEELLRICDVTDVFEEELRRSYLYRHMEMSREEGLVKGREEGLELGLVKGTAAGLATSIQRLLASKGFNLSFKEMARINSCTNADTLDHWFEQALKLGPGDRLVLD
jgi:hypothetical protein